jgi:ATP synthase j chain
VSVIRNAIEMDTFTNFFVLQGDEFKSDPRNPNAKIPKPGEKH